VASASILIEIAADPTTKVVISYLIKRPCRDLSFRDFPATAISGRIYG
jgi:hypothetical protein